MDKSQFEKVYAEIFNDVYRFSYYLAGNAEDAEDLTSEAFIKFYNYKNSADIQNPKFWLLKVTRNMAYDKFKKQKMISIQSSTSEEGGYQEFKEVGRKSLEDEVISEELMGIIKRELKNLDEVSAEIIALKVWEELKFNEIAEITDLNESTVKLKYYRGLDKLKANISIAEDSGSVKLRSFTLPILLAGIYQFGLVDMFKPELEFVKQTSKVIFGAINLNIIQGIMTKSTIAATTTAAATTTTGAVVTGGLLATGVGKAILGIGGAVVLGTVGFAGFNYVQNKDKIPAQDELKPVEEEKNEVETKTLSKYTNKNYPDFSFEYDSAKWTVSEKEVTGQRTDITVKSADTTLTFQAISALIDGMGSCGSKEYKVVSGTVGRVKDENNWKYYNGVYEKGTSKFKEYVNVLQDVEDQTNAKYCLDTIWFDTESKIKNVNDKDVYPFEFYPGHVSISVEGKDLEAADQVVSSMTYKNVQAVKLKTCKMDKYGMSVEIPENWSCKLNAQGNYEIKTEQRLILVHNFGRDLTCRVGEDPLNNDCETQEFYKDGNISSYTLYSKKNGKTLGGEILGITSKEVDNIDIQISMEFDINGDSDQSYSDLTSQEKAQLIEMFKSLKL